MSDLRPPQEGPAPAPLGPNESILNPNDASRLQSRGAIRPDMTVREALGVMGIDVDGPISQITPQLTQQVQNASLQGKISNTQPSPGGAPGAVPGAAPGGGMDELLRGR